MDQPEYLICINCESPCYTFEIQDGKVVEAMCMVCGEDEPDGFVSEEEFDATTA